jgi:hypothetical protein
MTTNPKLLGLTSDFVRRSRSRQRIKKERSGTKKAMTIIRVAPPLQDETLKTPAYNSTSRPRRNPGHRIRRRASVEVVMTRTVLDMRVFELERGQSISALDRAFRPAERTMPAARGRSLLTCSTIIRTVVRTTTPRLRAIVEQGGSTAGANGVEIDRNNLPARTTPQPLRALP